MIEDNTKRKSVLGKTQKRGRKDNLKIQMKRSALNTSCDWYTIDNMKQSQSFVKLSTSSKNIETRLPKTPNN